MVEGLPKALSSNSSIVKKENEQRSEKTAVIWSNVFFCSKSTDFYNVLCGI
jgi:hypothetical protein